MIADTCFLVHVMRAQPEAAARLKRMAAEREPLVIPTVAIFELCEGIELADRPYAEQRRVEEVIANHAVLPFDARHAQRAGRLSGELARKGQMIDAADAQIAGVALVENLPVLTRNRKHFERVPGLRVETY